MNKRMMMVNSAAVVCSSVFMMGCAHGQAGAEVAASAPAAAVSKPARDAKYDKPGFYTEIDAKDGRIWVFKEGSADLAEYKGKGKPARHVLRPGAGPDGKTLKSTESSTILEYVASKPGFYVSLDKDERLWIFAEGSQELAEYKEKGKPARHVVRPGAGPLGMTIKSADFDVLDAYQAAK
jgi:hypothetical protein